MREAAEPLDRGEKHFNKMARGEGEWIVLIEVGGKDWRIVLIFSSKKVAKASADREEDEGEAWDMKEKHQFASEEDEGNLILAFHFRSMHGSIHIRKKTEKPAVWVEMIIKLWYSALSLSCS